MRILLTLVFLVLEAIAAVCAYAYAWCSHAARESSFCSYSLSYWASVTRLRGFHRWV